MSERKGQGVSLSVKDKVSVSGQGVCKGQGVSLTEDVCLTVRGKMSVSV